MAVAICSTVIVYVLENLSLDRFKFLTQGKNIWYMYRTENLCSACIRPSMSDCSSVPGCHGLYSVDVVNCT